MRDPAALMLAMLGQTGDDGLNLDAATSPWAAALLTPHGLDRLTIAEPQVSALAQDGRSLLLTGRTCLAGIPCRAILRWLDRPAGLEVRLRLELGADAKIADLFGPGTQPPSIVAANGLPVEQASVLAELVVANAVFETATGDAPPGFTGDIDITGTTLGRYSPFPFSTPLNFKGTWAQKGDYRSFTLQGASTASLPLPSFIDGYGLRITNDATDRFSGTGPLSAAQLYLTATEYAADLTAPLLQGDRLWPAVFSFTDGGLSPADGLQALTDLLGVGSGSLITLPAGVNVLSDFALQQIALGLRPGFTDGDVGIDYVGAVISSTTIWTLPIPFHNSISIVGASYMYRPRTVIGATMTGQVFGELTLGSQNALTLQLNGALPRYDFSIAMGNAQSPSLSGFLNDLGLSVPDWGVTIADFSAAVDFPEREFRALMTLDGDIPLVDGTLSLTRLGFAIDHAQGGTSGYLMGALALGPDKAEFDVTAAYGGAGGGWTFSGGLAGSDGLRLTVFVEQLLGIQVDWIPDVRLQALNFNYTWAPESSHLATAGAYAASGTLSTTLPLGRTVLGYDLNIAASLGVTRAGKTDPSIGWISGTFAIHDISIVLKAALEAGATHPTYTFEVAWDGVTVDATLADVPATATEPEHRVVTLTLQGVTVGDIAGRLAAFVNPNVSLSLDAPWDALLAIDLSGMSLAIDLNTHGITVLVPVAIDLGFASLTSVGLVYDKSSGQGALRFAVCGSFLGQDYGPDAPLTWDASDDPPPATPGTGKQLIDLSFFGIGQHVGIGAPATIDAALANMRTSLTPTGDGNPFKPDVFDADKGWVIGLDATLLGFIELKMLFDDPQLYGMILGMSGSGAGAMAGLRLEMSYKKVSNSVGLFHVEIAIPDAYRQFNIGAVSVTLGIIAVDVYTDGGFVVDLGYPVNGDYTRAFTVEAGVFIGRGGFYFGVLQSGTSDRLPAITNGNFAPAIVAGLGLAVGVGRTFDKGPLSAGIYVQLEGIFDGVLAWFHPSDTSQVIERFYHIQAMVGIAGQLYGSVDFGVVSASLSVSFSATATLTLQACQASKVYLSVSVSVEASVKVLFVRVHFSFSMDLDVSFVMGQDSTSPWMLANGGASDSGFGFRRIYAAPRRSKRDALDRLRDQYHWSGGSYQADAWNANLNLYPDNGKVVESLSVVLGQTQLSPTVVWPDGRDTPPAPSPGDPQLIVMLIATTRLGAPPLSAVIETMLRWAFTAAGQPANDGVLNVGALTDLAAHMHDADVPANFAYLNLATLFGNNLIFQFLDHDAGGDIPGAAVLPMIPLFQRTDGGDTTVAFDYFTDHPVSAQYERNLRTYFAALKAGQPQARAVRATAEDSFATALFEDYFLLVTQAAVGAATDLVRDWQDRLGTDQSLACLARTYSGLPCPYIKPAGGTLDQLATAFGLSTDELAFLDSSLVDTGFAAAAAGDKLMVSIGVTPQSIGAGNPDALLFAADSCDVGPIAHHVLAGDTLCGIAGSDAALTAWLARDDANAIVRRAQTLMSGAQATLAGWTYTNPFEIALQDVATIFYARIQGLSQQATTQDLPWIQSFVAQHNPGLTVGIDGTIGQPGGTVILVPKTLPASASSPAPTDTRPWTLAGGDTIGSLAAAVLLAIDQNADPAFPAIAAKFTSGPAHDSIAVPADLVLTVHPGEMIADLASRMGFDPAAPVFATLIGGLAILRPMQVLMPDRTVATTGLTLGALAAQLSLAVEDLAGRPAVANTVGLFKAAELFIRHAPLLPVEELVKRALEPKQSDPIRGQVSRFMLHGMRVPTPQGDDLGPLEPMYVLSGQQADRAQFAVGGDAFSVTLTLPAEREAQWIRNDQLPNPLTIIATLEDADSSLPAATVAPTFLEPPQPTVLTKAVPPVWSIARRLSWLVPVAPLPGLTANPPPGIWPLPDAMLTRPDSGGTPFQYALATLPAQPGADDQPQPVATWYFGTLIDLVIRTTGTANVYELIGADSQQRSRLLQLWQNLTETDELALLYRPAASAGAPPGLASTDAPAGTVTLIKTNLSTETRGDTSQVAAVPPPSVATMANGGDFARLTWECSTVGGGGYWLVVGNTLDEAIPADAFDGNGQAVIALLAVAEPGALTQPLQRYQNVAVVGDAINPAITRLVATDPAAPPTAVAIVDPGIVAFEMQCAAPVEPAKTSDDIVADAAVRAQEVFQLLGYRLADSPEFAASTIGLPVGPQQRSPDKARDGATTPPPASPPWSYGQSLPIYRFAKHSCVVDRPALPLAADNVYAGIVLDAHTGKPAEAQVEIWFQDVYGNVSVGAPTDSDTAPAPYPVPLPVRYVDPILGVTQWPSCSAKFSVAGDAATPELALTLIFQGSGYWPGANQTKDAVADSLGKHAAQYARVYYQLHQADMMATLQTSLTTQDAPAPAPIDLAPMRTFAGAAYAYLNAIDALVVPQMWAGSIGSLLAAFPTSYDALAAANLDQTIVSLFAPSSIAPFFPVPVLNTFVAGGAMQDLCAEPASALQNSSNVAQPLQPGTELTIKPFNVDVVTDTPNAVTGRYNCTLATLVAANIDRPCLRPGFAFVSGVGKVVTGANFDTIGKVVAGLRFQGVPISPAALIASVLDAPIFDGTMIIAGYIVQPGDTLTANGSRDSVSGLAKRNVGTINLFPAGTSVWCGTVDGSDCQLLSLGAYAEAFGLTPGQVMQWAALGDTAPGVDFILPGVLAFPNPDAATTPIRHIAPFPAAGLANVGQYFWGADPETFVLDNWNTPAWLVPDQMVGHEKVRAGDTPSTLAARFHPPLQPHSLRPLLQAAPASLATGAAVIAPPAVNQQPTSGLAAVAAEYGVDPVALAMGNMALSGWLMPGTTVDYEGSQQILPGPLNGLDGPSPMSLAGLIACLANNAPLGADPALFDAALVIQALCADASLWIVYTGGIFLIPPQPAVAAQPLVADGTYPTAVIPVDASLTLARNPALVDPALIDTTTASITTPIAPAASVRTDDSGRTTYHLLGFATTAEAILPNLRICSGSADPDNPALPRLSALVLGTDGISAVTVRSDQPVFYALRPLYPQSVTRNQPSSPATANDPPAPPALQDVDVEIWARQLLSDVDTFLAAPLAAAAAQLAPAALGDVLSAKDTLADAITAGLLDVLAIGDTDPTALAAAQSALRQSLLRSCSQAYDLDVMVQVPGDLSAAGTPHAIRLPVVPVESDGIGKGLTMAGSKLGDPASAGYLHVSVGVGAAPTPAVDLNIALKFKQVEFDAAPVEQGYDTSRWVTLLSDVNAGLPTHWSVPAITTAAPLPTRSFPIVPQLLGQSAAATYPDTTDVAQAPLWSFTLSLEHASMPQDQIVFAAFFNRGAAIAAATPKLEPDLADMLSAYINGPRAQIWADLMSSNPAKQGAAMSAFAAALDPIVKQWQQHWQADETTARLARLFGPELGLADSPDLSGYVATLDHDPDGTVVAVTLEKPATAWPIWPRITITAGGTSYQLAGREQADGTCLYPFPSGAIATGTSIVYQISLDGLPLARYQDATAAVWVIRNAQLLGPDKAASRLDFIYRAPPVLHPYSTAPQLSFTGPFVLPAWDPVGTAAALDALATAVLLDRTTGASLNFVALEAAYAIDTIAANLPLRTPIAYTPSIAYTTTNGIGAGVVGAVETWLGQMQPSPSGRIEFSLTAFSTLPNRTSQPILSLRGITAWLSGAQGSGAA